MFRAFPIVSSDESVITLLVIMSEIFIIETRTHHYILQITLKSFPMSKDR